MDPFLACLALALAPAFGWTSLLDPAVATALLHPLVLLITLLLYGTETLAERSQPTFIYWHVLQLVARPLTGALLATQLLGGRGWITVGAVLTFMAVVVLAHGLKVGLSALGWWVEPRPRAWLLSAVEDAGVVMLVAIAHQVAGPLGAAVPLLLLVGILGSFPVLRAAVYAYVLAWSRSWGSLEPFEWRPQDDLTPRAAASLRERATGHHRPVRVARAAALRTGRLFQPGWLAVGPSIPMWVGTSGRVVPIPPKAVRAIIPGALYTRVFVERDDGRSSILVLPKSGPSAGVTAVELDARSALTGPEPWFLGRVVA